MTRFALPFAALLFLSACGDKQQPAIVNETVSDSGLEQENVIAGDVTAIDAATADDAQMANDMAPPALDDEGDNNSSSNSAGGNDA